MKRKIVRFDEDKRDGCGLCVDACAEGAIQVVDGKARLARELYCDGLGACLDVCPRDAIIMSERDAPAFDPTAVEERLKKLGRPLPPKAGHGHAPAPPHAGHAPAPDAARAHGGGHGGCPGSRMMDFGAKPAGGASGPPDGPAAPGERSTAAPGASGDVSSQLSQWPVQLRLVSPAAPYFQGADVVLAADCVAYALGDFHASHLKGKKLAIACPKLDDGQEEYLEKLVALIDEAKINTLTVMIMRVPCCRGLLGLAQRALEAAKRKAPLKAVVAGIQGGVLSEEWVRA
ncbi:MAG: 4Fe-4S ferredoxin [Elusimicrobia bacterium]|nr:4Fe-4S ferredoxin [Elusimicrobiota bacterium]